MEKREGAREEHWISSLQGVIRLGALGQLGGRDVRMVRRGNERASELASGDACRVPGHLSRKIVGWIRFRLPIQRIDDQASRTFSEIS
jgi:hypothetical protein